VGVIGFLIVFPLIAAVVCLLTPNQRVREVVVYVAAACIGVGSIVLASNHLTGGSTYYTWHAEWVNWVCLIVDLALAAYVMWRALNEKRRGVFALACVQALLVCVLEFGVTSAVNVRHTVYMDALSSIMVLVIGIIGSGIVVYAVGYMRDFQHHQDELAAAGEEAAPDRQNVFFAVMFAFLSAMFGIVSFNDMAWMLTAWEVTTVCSFFLIGYTKTREATNNSFRQIWMNMLGGIAFTLAVIYMGSTAGIVELDRFVNVGIVGSSFTMLPLALLAFAALTKAAQMPFHTWLLGAMVAPTPTSALLHSSTMVKAGVFLLIRLSPLMGTFVSGAGGTLNPVGVSVMLVGCITFLLCSFIAISQTNAKRVLAYSTIANLGLIVTCAGIGTAAAVWAAIFLLIFHAAAKSLLFLCVGTAEHHIGSRDIESMDALVSRMPKLACLMALGICGMFIAPFGMLISKWAALGAFIDSGLLVLIIMMAFGSAATFFFWAKWLGKILCRVRGQQDLEQSVHGCEWVALGIMAALVVLLTVGLPFISEFVVSPYASSLVGGVIHNPAAGDLLLMAISALVVLCVPAVVVLKVRSEGRADQGAHDPNLGGVGLGGQAFRGSLGGELAYEQRNWYMDKVFNEKKLSALGSVLCVLIALAGIACALVMSYLSYFVGSVM
jgi:ech hydrogenase subunit A